MSLPGSHQGLTQSRGAPSWMRPTRLVSSIYSCKRSAWHYSCKGCIIGSLGVPQNHPLGVYFTVYPPIHHFWNRGGCLSQEFRYWVGSVRCCDRRGRCRDGYFDLLPEVGAACQASDIRPLNRDSNIREMLPSGPHRDLCPTCTRSHYQTNPNNTTGGQGRSRRGSLGLRH